MALHRDIYWVGRQWAVTGYGMQAVDQKQKSKFDIEASRLWEDDLAERLVPYVGVGIRNYAMCITLTGIRRGTRTSA